MQKFILYIFSLFTFHVSGLDSTEITSTQSVHTLTCASEFKDLFVTLQKLPRAKEFIDSVLQEGPISIQVNTYFPPSFTAYWDSEERTIWLTTAHHPSEGDLLSSLLFEFHNASRQKEFHYYDSLASNRKMSKSQYVETIEFIEYQNVVATASLLDEGIEKDFFPSDCKYLYDTDFKTHFLTQKATGHSRWLEELYDAL